jgi:hypothetical protein
MTDLTVAQTILTQLGGTRFMAMTGAKDFLGSESALTFSLPRIADCKVRKVRVELTDDDLYKVTFWRFGKRPALKVEAEIDGVYCDALQEVFTRHTGLRTRL